MTEQDDIQILILLGGQDEKGIDLICNYDANGGYAYLRIARAYRRTDLLS